MKREPAKLPMTNEEIRREYLEAKDPKAQIRILADENLCSVGRIKDVLKREGVWEPRKYERKAAPIGEDDPLVDLIDACDDDMFFPYKEGGGNTDALLHIKEAVTTDPKEAEKLKFIDEEHEKYITKMHTVKFSPEEYETVNAIALHMLDLNEKERDRLEAEKKKIDERIEEQRVLANHLRGILEKVGGIPDLYVAGVR